MLPINFWCCPSHVLGISLDMGKKNPIQPGAGTNVCIWNDTACISPGAGEGHAGCQPGPGLPLSALPGSETTTAASEMGVARPEG